MIEQGTTTMPMRMPSERTDKEYLREKFPPSAMKILANLQLVIGVIVVVTQGYLTDTRYYSYLMVNVGTGFWTGLPFLATGLVGLFGARHPSKCM